MSIMLGAFNQIITTISSVSKNKWGDKTRTTVYSNVPCRWQERIGRVAGPDSEVKDYRIEAWVSNAYTILYDYEITKNSEIFKLVAIEKRYDLAGNLDHTKMYLV